MDLDDRIGILATHSGTLESTSQMIQEQITLRGKQVEVKALLCAGAFDAMKREDWGTHDRIVLEHLNRLMEDVEAVVIPQPSIERVVKQIPKGGYMVPILSSARLSVQHLKAKLDGLAMST
jgi:hypothetical protein